MPLTRFQLFNFVIYEYCCPDFTSDWRSFHRMTWGKSEWGKTLLSRTNHIHSGDLSGTLTPIRRNFENFALKTWNCNCSTVDCDCSQCWSENNYRMNTLVRHLTHLLYILSRQTKFCVPFTEFWDEITFRWLNEKNNIIVWHQFFW